MSHTPSPHAAQKRIWDAEQRELATRVVISEGACPFVVPRKLPPKWTAAIAAALCFRKLAPAASAAATTRAGTSGMQLVSAMDTLIRSARLPGGDGDLATATSTSSLATASLAEAAEALLEYTRSFVVPLGVEGLSEADVPASAAPRPMANPIGYLAVARRALGLEEVGSVEGALSEGPAPETLPALSIVAGVDISFVKDTDLAVASVVVLSFPGMVVLHTEMQHVTMTVPYVPGYLAFREVPLVAPLIDKIRRERPELTPQLLLVDGNGVHHPRGCGFATHLGVAVGIPSIGCAKNMLVVDGIGRDEVTAALQGLVSGVPSAKVLPLIGASGALWGFAALTGNSLTKPIFVSPGYGVGFGGALLLALAMSVSFRVPEPIRQADLQSREYIRKHEAQLLKEAALVGE